MIGGVAATWVATQVLIPAFGGSATFYWAYGQFGPTLGSALANMLTHPLHAVHVFVTPVVKARTMIGLLAAFGFLPLASPMVVAALPLLAERMLASGYPFWWWADYQYDAFVVMMLCCAAVDGAARLQRHWPASWDRWLTYPFSRPAWLRHGGTPWKPATLWAAGICAAALVYFPSSPFGPCCTQASTGSMRGCGRPRQRSRTCPREWRWRRPTTSARGCPAGTRCCCWTGRPGGRRG